MVTTAPEAGIAPREESIKARYEDVRARIAAAAARGGRTADEVVLVAVTKYASMDQIRELISLGHVDLGESRAQSLVQHAAQVDDFIQRLRDLHSARKKHGPVPDRVRWHLIGHLQRNKVRKIIGLARLIHSVDSLRLAEEIQPIAAVRQNDPVEVLIQVNVSGEKQKYGVAPAATRHLIEQVDTMFNVRVRGLMCMAPQVETPEETRPVFERARELFDDIHRSGIASDRFNILSMGMSSDYEIAVECGANVVRVGTSIFGEPDETME